MIKTLFSSKNSVFTSRSLELLHINLFGPTSTTFVNGKRYGRVVMGDYSRLTWGMFVSHKNESFEILFKLCKRIQNEKGVCITPTWTTSVSGKRYSLVVVDDYSRWTWVMFLAHKNESFGILFKFYKRIQNEKGVCITSIISDHGGDFENESFHLFYEENGILHNLSTIEHHNKMV